MPKIKIELSLSDMKDILVLIKMDEECYPTEEQLSDYVNYLNLQEIKRQFGQRLIQHNRKSMQFKTKISLDVNLWMTLITMFDDYGYLDGAHHDTAYWHVISRDILESVYIGCKSEIEQARIQSINIKP